MIESKSTIEFSGEGGLAGNLFVGALLALGGNKIVNLENLIDLLGMDSPRVDYRQTTRHGRTRVRFEFRDCEEEGQGGNLARMEKIIKGAHLPDDCAQIIQAILVHRQSALAKLSGKKPTKMRWYGEAFADTLLDVAASVLLWNALERPAIVIQGALVLGKLHPAVRGLLPKGLLALEGEGLEQVTPTAAALLYAFWRPGANLGQKTRTVFVEGSHHLHGFVPATRATLYY